MVKISSSLPLYAVSLGILSWFFPKNVSFKKFVCFVLKLFFLHEITILAQIFQITTKTKQTTISKQNNNPKLQYFYHCSDKTYFLFWCSISTPNTIARASAEPREISTIYFWWLFLIQISNLAVIWNNIKSF